MNWYKTARFITEEELREKARSTPYSLFQCVECGRWIDFMKKAITDWKFENEMSKDELKVVAETKEAIENGRGRGLSTCRYCVSKTLKFDREASSKETWVDSKGQVVWIRGDTVNSPLTYREFKEAMPSEMSPGWPQSISKDGLSFYPPFRKIESDTKEAGVDSTMSVSP